MAKWSRINPIPIQDGCYLGGYRRLHLLVGIPPRIRSFWLLFWPLGAASLLLITLLVQLEMLTLNSEVLDTVQP